MEKRSAARELAFLALFQLPQKPDKKIPAKLAKTDFHAICLSAIRTLADNSKDNVKRAEAFFIKTERALMEHQVNHPENEALDEATRAVPVPKTDEFLDHLNNCYQSIALMKESMQIPELYWHYQDSDIEEFTLSLLMQYADHYEEAQNLIKEVSTSWNPDRMQKVDRLIIELALTEISNSDIAPAVVVSEALKLANKYSSPEGVKFINGILADLIKLVQV